MPGALEGLRVLDLTWGAAGALGVLLVAEQGADTIKVEPPGGDPFRRYDGYKVWTRSRRAVQVDLKSDAGRAAFLRLVETADVVVESFRPGVADRLGVGFGACAAVNPRLVYCSVPGWPEGHRNADRPGYDALVQAASGQQWEQPGWRPGPIFLAMPVPSMGAIYLVASGVLAALVARESTGRGQHVRTSLLQGVFLYTTQIWQEAEHADPAFYGLMAKTHPPGVHQGMLFECANREFVHISVMSGLTPLKSLDEVLGVEAPPPSDLAGLLPLEQQLLLNERRREAFLRWPRDQLIAELLENNHAVEAVVEPEDQFAHPQLQANGMVAVLEDPDLGPCTQIGVPIHLLGTPGRIVGPQPRVGEHDAAVWGGLGFDGDEITAITGGGTPVPLGTGARRPESRRVAAPPAAPSAAVAVRRALDGVRVLDFGQYLAGPFGPMILADLGADVIKVEPIAGDGMRMAATPFFGCQRGKRDIALNVKQPEGLQLALELVRGADVVHHNMTKGTAARLGLDYAACRAVNPAVVYCNTYAYGLEGPLSHFGGLDPLYQASAGLEHEAGAVRHGHQPLYYRYGMCDASNAMLSVVGVLAALVHQRRSGQGQELWTSLMDGGAVFASDVLLDRDGNPSRRPKLDAHQQGFGPFYRLYETNDGWIQVCAVTDADRASLFAGTGVDPATAPDAIDAALEAAFATKTAVTWSHVLDEAGVPNEVAVDVDGGRLALYDADAERLGLVTQYEHPLMGRLRQFGETISFSDTPGRIFGPPPRVGEHTRALLEELGISTADQDRLRAEGVVGWPDESYAWGW
ncbi:MAG TPA: CoA transferase [Acidimicrobiia bacterium]|nr:CoA transferase [Acidimicrobiia bacterium]